MVRLTDRNNQNESYYCNNCSCEFLPEQENVRRESKLSVPDRNQETLVTTTPGIDYLTDKVELHHEPKLNGGILSLSKKGTIKITKFEDSSQK